MLNKENVHRNLCKHSHVFYSDVKSPMRNQMLIFKMRLSAENGLEVSFPMTLFFSRDYWLL